MKKSEISKYFSEIGKKGGSNTKKRGSEYYRNLQKMGVEARRKNKLLKEGVDN